MCLIKCNLPIVNVAGNLINLNRVMSVTQSEKEISIHFDNEDVFTISFETEEDKKAAMKQFKC